MQKHFFATKKICNYIVESQAVDTEALVQQLSRVERRLLSKISALQWEVRASSHAVADPPGGSSASLKHSLD